MGKNDDLSQRIRTIREALGATQEQFAVRLGIHRVSLANIERGRPFGTAVSRKLTAFVEEFERKVS